MWNSVREVRVTETSFESCSVIDTRKRSRHLKRSPKAKMTDIKETFRRENIYENSCKENVQDHKLCKENVKADCISREAIPLPWVPEKVQSEREQPEREPETTNEELLKSPVSEKPNKRVVVELKWLDSEPKASRNGSVEPAACGIKASLTLAEADKVNEFIAHLKRDKANDVEVLTEGGHTGDVPCSTLGEASNSSQGVLVQTANRSAAPIVTTQADGQLGAINSLTDEKPFSTVSARGITPVDTSSSFLPEAITQKYSRQDRAHSVAGTYYSRAPSYSTKSNDTEYSRVTACDNPDVNNDLVQSALALARARRGASLQKTPNDSGDDVSYRASSRRMRDTMSLIRSLDIDSPLLSRHINNTGTKARASCEPLDFSLTDKSVKKGDPLSRLSTNGFENSSSDTPLTRISKRATSMPAASRIRRDVKVTERDAVPGNLSPSVDGGVRDDTDILRGATPSRDDTQIIRGITPLKDDVQMERGTTPFMDDARAVRGTTPFRDDARAVRGTTPFMDDARAVRGTTPFRDDIRMGKCASPFTKKPLILPEIIEEPDKLGDIIDELELLTTYHGAGVLCPLLVDDVPEPILQREDPRRGRSVSVMRKLLSDGEGQFSRESTPMSNLRRHFKVKMKVANFHETASQGDLNTMTSLLLEGEDFDIDSKDEMERTALHLAAERGHTDIVSLLIERGCNVNLTDAGGRTPLHCAVEGGEVGVVSALLSAGAAVDVMEKSRGRTPIHLATVANSLDVLKLLLQPLMDDPWEAMRIVKVADKDGRTLLHMTAHHGLQEATSLLLSAGAEVNAKDFSGNTPMHAVILTRLRKKERICARVLEVLLDSGGDVEGGGGGDEGGDAGTLLHAAASVGCMECLRVLVKRTAKMEAKDFFGKTPLQIAIEEGHADVVSYLLDNHASAEEADSRGQRPLHHAIMADSPRLLEELFVGGADKNARDREGKTYFQFAIVKRRYQALSSLVKNKVIDVGEDQLAIHYCVSIGNQAALEVLLDNAFNVNEVDPKGRTALHHAISSGHESLVLYLLANGSSTRRADENGATPLHYAVRWGGSDALLRRLVKKQGNVNAVDRLGRTPLHYAASKSSIMSDMFILINSGAQINAKDARGLTPLHLAARLGNESLVRILLDNNARHDIQDCDNFQPIDHAKEKEHKNIIKRLEAYHIRKEREKEARLPLYIHKTEIEDDSDDQEKPHSELTQSGSM